MKVNDAVTTGGQGIACGNFLDIQYTSIEACRKALSYNGAWWDACTVIGVVSYGNHRRRINIDENKVDFILSN